MSPGPSIAAFSEADGKLSMFVASVGLKMRGTLLETVFSLKTEVSWPEYPIRVK